CHSLSVLRTGPEATESYTLSLHDALPICEVAHVDLRVPEGVLEDVERVVVGAGPEALGLVVPGDGPGDVDRLLQRVDLHVEADRSEEHTSELQSRENLVCRLLLEKKKYHK